MGTLFISLFFGEWKERMDSRANSTFFPLLLLASPEAAAYSPTSLRLSQIQCMILPFAASSFDQDVRKERTRYKLLQKLQDSSGQVSAETSQGNWTLLRTVVLILWTKETDCMRSGLHQMRSRKGLPYINVPYLLQL